MGYIYLVTNLLTGHQYVGQTIRKDIETRWNQHRKIHKNAIGNYLYNAYMKYGIANFSFKIICLCFDEDCNRLEEEYIQKFKTLAPNGYNLQSGGNNWHHHPETKEKMSKSLKGRKAIKITDKWRSDMSERMTGSKNPNYGKAMTKEQKEAISKTIKTQYSSNSKVKNLKGLEKGRIKLIEENKFFKKVAKYDLSGDIIESFNSISDASEKTGVCFSTISRVCAGKPHYKTAGGFFWKFI